MSRLLMGIVILASMACVAAEPVVYYDVPLDTRQMTSGTRPSGAIPHRVAFTEPAVVMDGGEEAYTLFGSESNRWADESSMGSVVCAAGNKPPSGFLLMPNNQGGIVKISFVCPSANPDQAAAKKKFEQARQAYYARLVWRGVPGGAWFRHMAGGGAESAATGFPPRTGPPDADIYSTFTGGRAISENIQLDRELQVTLPGSQTVPMDTIAGITIQEYNWASATAGLQPAKDALATVIPADQHVLFFPSFQAMVTVIEEAKARGIPIFRLTESRAEDAQTQQRYERQLCLELDALSRLLGASVIKSVAFTGSDPYLRTGSDVAVVFQPVDAAILSAALADKHKKAAASDPAVKTVSGEVLGVAYTGVTSADRRVCSYLATVGGAVVVTNSLYQLERLAATALGTTPAVATLPEYTFFRDRYKLNDPAESAFLLVTDATIRRWCGPRWRILAARRTRAAAVLAELQARNLDAMVTGGLKPGPLHLEKPAEGMGDLSVSGDKIVSSIHGSLEFLTPIGELPSDSVSPEEEAGYERFRDTYQQNWRRYFDPIAIRLTVRPEQLAADLTVRPLIHGTSYRDYMEVTSGVQLSPNAGDPHKESLLQYVTAFNHDAPILAGFSQLLSRQSTSMPGSPLAWMGNAVTIFADADPFWQELAKNLPSLQQSYTLLLENFTKIPVVMEIDIANAPALAIFLTTLRAYIDGTVGGILTWEPAEHDGQTYVKITLQQQFATPNSPSPAIYYAPTPKKLVIGIKEETFFRTLNRLAARNGGKGDAVDADAGALLGKSVCLQARNDAFQTLRQLIEPNVQSALQRRAWGNIPILNEWRRRYPQIPPVEFHQRFWQTRLVSPGGGDYVWNEECKTMESTLYGHPGYPRMPKDGLDILATLGRLNFGLTFEEDGLRAQAAVNRK